MPARASTQVIAQKNGTFCTLFVDKTCTFNPNSTQMQVDGKFKFNF